MVTDPYQFIKVFAGFWCVLCVELDGDLSLIGQKRTSDISTRSHSPGQSYDHSCNDPRATFVLVSPVVYHGGFQYDGRHPDVVLGWYEVELLMREKRPCNTHSCCDKKTATTFFRSSKPPTRVKYE